jgi:hypothetical protein
MATAPKTPLSVKRAGKKDKNTMARRPKKSVPSFKDPLAEDNIAGLGASAFVASGGSPSGDTRKPAKKKLVNPKKPKAQ